MDNDIMVEKRMISMVLDGIVNLMLCCHDIQDYDALCNYLIRYNNEVLKGV